MTTQQIIESALSIAIEYLDVYSIEFQQEYHVENKKTDLYFVIFYKINEKKTNTHVRLFDVRNYRNACEALLLILREEVLRVADIKETAIPIKIELPKPKKAKTNGKNKSSMQVQKDI